MPGKTTIGKWSLNTSCHKGRFHCSHEVIKGAVPS